MSDLLLDDYGMMLLDQLEASYSDLEAILEHGNRKEEEHLVIMADNGAVDTIVLPPTDVADRYTDVMDLVSKLHDHILLLDRHRDIAMDRAMSWHVTLDGSFLGTMQSITSWDHIVKYIFLEGLVPIYRTFKSRQGDAL